MTFDLLFLFDSQTLSLLHPAHELAEGLVRGGAAAGPLRPAAIGWSVSRKQNILFLLNAAVGVDVGVVSAASCHRFSSCLDGGIRSPTGAWSYSSSDEYHDCGQILKKISSTLEQLHDTYTISSCILFSL